jgi:hypothetical protein
MPTTETVQAPVAPDAAAAGLSVASVNYEIHYAYEPVSPRREPQLTRPRTSFAQGTLIFGATWFFGIFLAEVVSRWLLGVDPGWNAATLGLAFACIVVTLSSAVGSIERAITPLDSTNPRA